MGGLESWEASKLSIKSDPCRSRKDTTVGSAEKNSRRAQTPNQAGFHSLIVLATPKALTTVTLGL